MSTTTPEHIKWLRYHCDKGALGMLTGQDARALATFAAALQLYSNSDSTGVMNAKLCMRFATLAMQPKCRQFAKKLIPWALDWNDEEPLWIELGFVDRGVQAFSKCRECGAEACAALEIGFDGRCGYCVVNDTESKTE